jgi:hypothetical protein
MNSIPISDRLLRNLSERRCRDEDLMRAFETGDAITHRARQPAKNPLALIAATFSRFAPRRKRNVDPAEATRKRRQWGGGSCIPDDIKPFYTEGERAALGVIAEEVKRVGFCSLALETIANAAGVGRTTVQNAIRKARSVSRGDITVQLRPQPGSKNLTNIIRIVSRSWLRWLKRSIGFKTMNPSEIDGRKSAATEHEGQSLRAFEGESADLFGVDNRKLQVGVKRKSESWHAPPVSAGFGSPGASYG